MSDDTVERAQGATRIFRQIQALARSDYGGNTNALLVVYMASFRADVIRAIETPTHRIEQPRPGQEWFYLKDAGPSRWLKVVVAFDEDSSGRIRTAFPRRSTP